MRYFAVCCTTKLHQLYVGFMSHISAAVFNWSKEDLLLLKAAKRSEMVMDKISRGRVQKNYHQGIVAALQTADVWPVERMELLHTLFVAFSGEAGQDTLGVPLLDEEQRWEVWEEQKKGFGESW